MAWGWPGGGGELRDLQVALAAAADTVEPWAPPGDDIAGSAVAAVFAAFPTGVGGPGAPGQPLVTAAVVRRRGEEVERAVVSAVSGGPYEAGLLALRCGAALEGAVGSLQRRPDLLLVDATGRDHPRRAGLALHLGAVLDLPSVGVTNRPLVAGYEMPGERRGCAAPLTLAGETVGYAVRTRDDAQPVLAHAAWRTSAETARDVVLALTAGRRRTPEPLRAARTLARVERARREGRVSP